jgi:hypothetical protein
MVSEVYQMKSLFPGLSIICGTALLIAGNTTAGIVFACLGFVGAVLGAAIRHQQEQEALAIMKEFTEALKKNSTSENQIAEMQEAMGQLGGAFAELWKALTTVPSDSSWGSGGGNGGITH